MTYTTESIKKLSEVENTKWFTSVGINLSYNTSPKLPYPFKGLGPLYEFVTTQIEGWENLSENLPKKLEGSKKHFLNVEKHLRTFLDTHSNEKSESKLNSSFLTLKQNHIVSKHKYFTYDCPETGFLMDVHKNHPLSFEGG